MGHNELGRSLCQKDQAVGAWNFWGETVEDVSFLTLAERPRMNPGQIETLCNDLGPHAAEDMVCRAMEDIALRLCQIQQMASEGPRDTLYKDLRALSAVSEQIGLTSVASVARDVMDCIELGDRVAEAACLARLGRLGEGSLTALWDLQDLSV